MTDHVRQQIRARVCAVLSGLPTTGSRVLSGRARQLAKGHGPTLLVYLTEETSDVDAAGDVILRRVANLVVEGRATTVGANAAADMEDTLDRIALEVEPRLVADPSMQGLTLEVTLVGSRLNAVAPGETTAGEIVMNFRVVYRTRESAPQSAV